MDWSFDEKKTIIGNKKFNLKGRYFDVPDSLKNQNPLLQKPQISENNFEQNLYTTPKFEFEKNYNNINIEKIISSINNKPMHKERKEFLQILSEHEDKGQVTGVYFKRKDRESAWSEPYQSLENKNIFDYNSISSSGLISEEEVLSPRSLREDFLIGNKRKNSSHLEFPTRQIQNEIFPCSGIEVDFTSNNFTETKNLINNYDRSMNGFSYSNTDNIKQKKIPNNFSMKPGAIPKYSPMTVNYQNNLNNKIVSQGTLSSLEFNQPANNFGDEYEKISDNEEDGEIQNLEISINKKKVPIINGVQSLQIQPNLTPNYNTQTMTCNKLNNLVPPFYHHLPPFAQPFSASVGSLNTTYPIQSINMTQNTNTNKFFPPLNANISTVKVSQMKQDECRNISKNIPSAEVLRQEIKKLEQQKKLLEISKNNKNNSQSSEKQNIDSFPSSPSEFLNLNGNNHSTKEINKNDRNFNILNDNYNEMKMYNSEEFTTGKSNILKKESSENNKPLNFDFKSSENKLNDLFTYKKKVENFTILYKYRLISNYISTISKTLEKNTLNFEHFFTNQEIIQFGYINDLKITAQLETYVTETQDETVNFFKNLENEKVAICPDGGNIQVLIHSTNRHMLSIFNVDSQVEEKKNVILIITIYDKLIIDKINKFLIEFNNKIVFEKSQTEKSNTSKSKSEIINKSQLENLNFKELNKIADSNFKSQSPNSSIGKISEKDSNSLIYNKNIEKINASVQTQSLSDLVNTDEIVVKSYELEELRKLKLEFHQELDKQIKKKSEEIKQMYNIQIEIIKKESTEVKTKFTEKEILSNSLNREINELKINKESLEKNLVSLSSHLKSLMEDKDKFDQEFNSEKVSNSEKNKKISTLKLNIKELKTKCDELEKIEKNHLKLQKQIKLQVEELTQKNEELVKENLVLKMAPKEISNHINKPAVSINKMPNNVDGFLIQEFTEEEEIKSSDVMIRQLAEDFLCLICGEKMRNYVNEECRHLIYCHECLLKTINKHTETKKLIAKIDDKNTIKIKQAINCPTCRVPNTVFKKVIVS